MTNKNTSLQALREHNSLKTESSGLYQDLYRGIYSHIPTPNRHYHGRASKEDRAAYQRVSEGNLCLWRFYESWIDDNDIHRRIESIYSEQMMKPVQSSTGDENI